MFFQNIFRLWAEKFGVQQKSTSMFVTTTFYESGGTLRSNILKQVLKQINFFGSFVNFPRQHRKIIFRVDKTAIIVWRKKLRKILFQEKKTYYFKFFKILHAILLPLAKNYRHGCQNCNLSTFRKFWRKLDFFFKWNMFANIFGLRDEKIGLLVKNFSSGFLQQEIALPEKCFEEKGFLFRECFFSVIILEFEWFLCLFAKLFSQVCQTTDHCAERIKWEN